jgi:ABC-type molybdate transport system substrate-binding protein
MRTLLFVAAVVVGMSAHAQESIRVYAAGSLRTALDDVAKSYKAAHVELVYGPSGLLRERILKGERADVFASANMDHPHSLALQGRAGPVKRFARNRLCALAGPRVTVDSDSLLDRLLDDAVVVGTSTPKADPSGDYAWQLFEKADKLRPGAFARLSAKARTLTGGPDSPAAPRGRNQYGALVADGQADIFLTYCTNALQARNENGALRIVQVPEALSVAADYGLALMEGSGEGAWNLAEYILSPEGQAILSKYGFSPGGQR